MGVVTHDGKVVITPNGKALNFNSLIDAANAVTGEDDKTLSDAIDSLIAGYEEPVLQQKTVSAGRTPVITEADEGYDGLSRVTVNGITKELLASLDSDFKAENIRAGKSIFGEVGTFSGDNDIIFSRTWTGTVTLAEEKDSVTVAHGLGDVPDFAAMIRRQPGAGETESTVFSAMTRPYRMEGGYNVAESARCGVYIGYSAAAKHYVTNEIGSGVFRAVNVDFQAADYSAPFLPGEYDVIAAKWRYQP